MRPRVYVNATTAAQFSEQVAINNLKLQTELVSHLLFPLHLNRGGTDDKDAPGAVAENKFLRD